MPSEGLKCRPIPTLTDCDLQRFWSKVDKSGDCWEWTAATIGGYGSFSIGDHTYKSHRISYAIKNGEPGNTCVCHTCDNPSCVNPDHLWLGTYRDNNHDRDVKGRAASTEGEANGQAELTEETVREILRSNESRETLAKRYGVDPAQISSIHSGKTWNHVEGIRRPNRAQSDNQLGVKGVYPTKYSFRARVSYQGRRYYLGSFKTIEEAEQAVINKRFELRG
jgi:hypothetical protein